MKENSSASQRTPRPELRAPRRQPGKRLQVPSGRDFMEQERARLRQARFHFEGQRLTDRSAQLLNFKDYGFAVGHPGDVSL